MGWRYSMSWLINCLELPTNNSLGLSWANFSIYPVRWSEVNNHPDGKFKALVSALNFHLVLSSKLSNGDNEHHQAAQFVAMVCATKFMGSFHERRKREFSQLTWGSAGWRAGLSCLKLRSSFERVSVTIPTFLSAPHQGQGWKQGGPLPYLSLA